MKAVFIKRDCLWQRKSVGGSASGALRLRPVVTEALRALAANEVFTILLDPGLCGHRVAESAIDGQLTQQILELLRSPEARVDALLRCPHAPGDGCACWGGHPGFLYSAAAQLDLRLTECYLLCDEANDVVLAHSVGCRAILVLNDHTVADLYGGDEPESQEMSMARDLAGAVEYLLCEEDGNQHWGYPRQVASGASEPEEMSAAVELPETSPALQLFSPLPVGARPLVPVMPQLNRRVGQLQFLFVVGGVWLSLGIAYMLTHLYRVQHFPEFVWYLTLQFIPRPIRGLLFIGSGMLLVGASLRAFLGVSGRQGGGKPPVAKR